MILALPRVGTGFREQLHTLRIRINLTIMLRCVGDGIRWLGGGGERDTNGLGGGVDLPTVRATLHPVLPGRNLILHKLVSKLD